MRMIHQNVIADFTTVLIKRYFMVKKAALLMDDGTD
jgi:hypothetical protein